MSTNNITSRRLIRRRLGFPAFIQSPTILKERKIQSELARAIEAEAGKEVYNYIAGHFSLERDNTILYSGKKKQLYEQVDFSNIRAVINLEKVNIHQNINAQFKAVNSFLEDAGIYIGCVETYDIKWNNLKKKYGKYVSKLFWIGDFILNRALPRMGFTKKLYSLLTHNNFLDISLAETLGRLKYCGFDIIEFKEMNNLVYFVAMKTCEPRKNIEVSTGLVFKMFRIGKGGKVIRVYKLRTMHPYSEYLQEFVLKLNGYNHLGKPANDFRLTGWGRVFRELWLDEIPQLYNVLRGELALVGVRPLSRVRFHEFPCDIRSLRIKYKPGCIPPYVSLNMPDSVGNIEAERIYLNELEDKGILKTKIKYFFLAVFNIVTRRIHSS